MKDPIQNVIRQTQGYWYVDGLTELATGVVLIAVSLVYVALGLMGPSSLADWLMGLGVPLLLLAVGLGGRWTVTRLKERLTYPRTGYVAYRTSQARFKLLSFVVAMVVSIVLVFGLVLIKVEWLKSAAPAILAAVLIAYIGQNYGLRRFYLLAGYTLLLGLPMAFLPLGDKFLVALLTGGTGLGFLVSGGLTLRRYLRTTRPAGELFE